MGQQKKRKVGHRSAQINNIRRPLYLHTFFILRDQFNRNLLIFGGRYWDRTSDPCHTFLERYVEVKSADHPNPWNGVFLMSYDPASNRWVRNGIDNSGERNAASSSGWNGDTWVWENDGVNIVINRKGGGAFTFAVDVKEAAGAKRVVEAECKRA